MELSRAQHPIALRGYDAAGQAGTPEIREYRIRAVIDDEEIGQDSVTLQITAS